jgi:pilus assembly protein Flp/PilA
VSAMELLRNFFNEETGANAVEYGLLMALIAMVIIVGINAFGTVVNNTLYVLANTIFSGS